MKISPRPQSHRVRSPRPRRQSGLAIGQVPACGRRLDGARSHRWVAALVEPTSSTQMSLPASPGLVYPRLRITLRRLPWSNMQGIKRIDKNYYRVRVYAMDRRVQPHRKVERARWVRGPFAEAKRVKAEMERQLQAEVAGANERMTLTVFAQRWLEARESELAPSTKAKYVNDLAKHILPALGEYLMDELRPSHLQSMLAMDQGAPNSRKNRLSLLRKMSKDAMRDGLIDRSFCIGLTVKVPPVYTEDQPNCLAGPRLDDVISKIPQHWLDPVSMSSFTGLRWGEVSAFHWTELDLDQAVGVVRWTNWKGTLRPPKTAAGFRVIPLAEPLVEILRKRRARMVVEKHPGLKRGLVFPTNDGELHRGTPLNSVLKKACRSAGVTIRFTPHGLRRTWNNIARRVSGGLVVRSMIGHASEAMTDHYSHVDMDEKRATAEAVARIIQARDESEKKARRENVGSFGGRPGVSGPSSRTET